MFQKNEPTDRTPQNDPDVESLFRKNYFPKSTARKEMIELNELVCLVSKKYNLKDVWGRTYKSKPQELSLRFSYSDINDLPEGAKHPIINLMEKNGISQLREQGECSHQVYSIFTFDSSKCNVLIQAVELLNPDLEELARLTEHAEKGQVLC